ncbi:DapH/DapD/GlmU-related protein [Rhodococcus sp. BP22]|uniref:acyltransferase n=1 Tax=Rhodococcus sp. BP22 TaxID=2758566 RepID=UPI0016445790|nr:DapH/DapD/GlmU-related protein [Rhodococcus sp. BP22]
MFAAKGVKRHGARAVRDLVRNRILASVLIPAPVRWRFYKLSGLDVAKSFIAPGLFVGGAGLRVSPGVILNYDCFVDATGKVYLGPNVAIGPGSRILTVTHDIGPQEKRRGLEQIVKGVRIEEGCWLGANVTVLPGVRIGAGTVVAAGSVVVSDLEENSVYAGVPSKLVRKIL